MRQNVLIKRLTTVFTTFSVFILITFRTNYTEMGEKLLFKDTKEICKPVNKVGFLKIHKCASSSVQNIILRYALKNDLNVVLPSAGNYLGLSTPFSRAMIKDTAWEKAGLEYHMFCLHTVWNQAEVERTLGGRAGVKYLTMIRDPVTTFESAWGYAQMSGFYKMDLETFALSPKTGLLSKNPFKPFGQNQMLHDFGLHPDNFNNSSAVLEKILEIEDNFNLVLLAERFKESMILMKNELCWEHSDMLNMKLNARQEKKKTSLSEPARKALEIYLSSDYLVYNHFKKIFERKLEQFGKEKMEKELNMLEEANSNIREICSLQETDNENVVGENKLWGLGVVGFKVDASKNPVCRFIAMSELNFLNLMREQLREKSNKSSSSV